MALEVVGGSAMETMSPILPGNRRTGVNYGLWTAATGGRRQCVRWVVAHIGKGMRDEEAGTHKQVEQRRKHWPPR